MDVREGYKVTEVGVVPEDWDVLSLDGVGRIIRGASPRPKGDRRFYGGAIPRLMVEDVTRDGKYVTPQVDFLTEEGAKLSRPCNKGALTIVCSGTVGVASFLAIDACIHDGFLAIVDVRGNYDQDYLYHQFCALRETFDASATHGGVFTNLTTSGIKDFVVAFPEKAEQQAIAEALSDADALIESLEQLIVKKQLIKQGAMQELLTGKRRLPGFDACVSLKSTDVGDIPKDWNVVPLSEVIDGLVAGVSVNSLAVTQNNVGLDDAVLKTSCVSNGKFIPAEKKWIDKKDLYRARCNPMKDTILVSRMNTPALVGESGYVAEDHPNLYLPDRLWMTQHHRQNDLSVKWLSLIISYPEYSRTFKEAASGTSSSMKNLSKPAFLATKIPLPSSGTEQIAIAQTLTDIDTEITALESRLTKARQIKQGMMQELLTGRIRLMKPAAQTA